MSSEPPRVPSLREQIARRLSRCPCRQPDCAHYPVDARAWATANEVLAIVGGWLNDVVIDCACENGGQLVCGACEPCTLAEAALEIAATITADCSGQPVIGHPESTRIKLDASAEEYLTALAARLWPGDGYLRLLDPDKRRR